MIRVCLVVLLFGIIVVNTVTAQDIDVIEQCVTDFVEPPDDWTFDGTLITYRQGDGVHGFRADTPSRYYIAFDSRGEFAISGAFSPDMQWFASFIGDIRPRPGWCCKSSYRVHTIRVVSITPDRKTFTIPFWKGYFGISGSPYFSPVLWLDNTTFIDFSGSNEFNSTVYLINPFEGSLVELPDGVNENHIDYGLPLEKLLYRRQIEIDETVDSTIQQVVKRNGSIHVTSIKAPKTVINTCIETEYQFAMSPEGNQVAISGQEGGFVYILDLDEWKAYRLDLAANDVVAWVADE